MNHPLIAELESLLAIRSVRVELKIMDNYDLPAGITFLISLKALIVKDGKILLLKNSNPENAEKPWELPGGLVEVAEELEQGLKREVVEETGMTISVGSLIEAHAGYYEKFTVKNGTTFKVRLIVITYQCTYLSGSLKISHEHSDGGFFSSKEITQIKISPHNFPALQTFLASH